MEIQAKFKSQQETVDRGNFKSRKVWVTTEENPDYPQTIEIEVHQAKVDMFNNIAPGAPVTLHLNLRGREWINPEGKTSVFNSLVCWKVEASGQAAQPAANSAMNQPPVKLPELDESLPF